MENMTIPGIIYVTGELPTWDLYIIWLLAFINNYEIKPPCWSPLYYIDKPK